MKQIVVLLVLPFLILSCSNNKETMSTDLYSISGKVSTEGLPIINVTVSIDDIVNYTSTTDERGNFLIGNVPSGEHSLKINKTFSSESGQSFSEKSYDIYVQEDTSLENLVLPNPVFLSIINHSESSISLNWNASMDSDFREYKVYRHTSPGLDETTGELIFVSTDISITSYNDVDLLANTDYYYRVFILNDTGKLGGSNLANQKTDNINFIKNGSFETHGSEFWDFYGCPNNESELNTSAAYDGNNSYQITRVSIDGNCGLYMRQKDQIAPNTISAGQRLELSFYYISDGEASFWLRIQDNQSGFVLIDNGENLPQTASESWVHFTKEYYVSSDYDNSNVNVKHLNLTISPPRVVGAKVLIDKISLVGK